MRIILGLAIVLTLAFTSTSEALAGPETLSHQGRMWDSTGAPIDATESVTFKLFPAMTGGTEVWSETLDVTFDNGYFSVVLGETTPVTASAVAVDSLWIELTVGTDTVGRLELTSVPWALSATNVTGGTVDASEIMIGGTTIISNTGTIDYGVLTGTPDDPFTTLMASCAAGNVVHFDGTAWACGTIDAGVISSGVFELGRLPMGTSSATAAFGDHVHTAADVGAMAIGTTAADIGALAIGTTAADIGALPDSTSAADIGALPDTTTAADLGALPAGGGTVSGNLDVTGTLSINGALLGNGGPQSYFRDCKDLLDNAGATANGNYFIDPDGAGGSVEPYIVYCNQVDEGGGWTRVINIDLDENYTSSDAFRRSQERVNNGTYNFSKTQMKNSNREVLILEKVAPFRAHLYDFKQGTNVAGEDFVGALTGDVPAEVGIWNWTQQIWELSGTTNCNANNHSQWNCVPSNGVRFHYATRNWMNNGGSSQPEGWTWFTGYNAGAYGPVDEMVKNWDGNFNKTPHGIYVR